MKKIIFFLVLALGLSNCDGPGKSALVNVLPSPSSQGNDGADVLYNLSQPEKTLKLGATLVEISGLTFLEETGELLAINDEMGAIFRLDPQNGNILEAMDFGKDGDYEGIELVDSIIYVLKSNGNLHPYNTITKKKEKTIKTNLNYANDVEGLGYDVETHSLLLACKESPQLKDEKRRKGIKAVFSYDLHAGKLKKKPVLEIADKDMLAFLENHIAEYKLPELELKVFKNRVKSFSPSGIAVHPQTGFYYIISTVGKLMVVLDRNSDIQQIYFLKPAIHAQPEGICFTPEEDLYISNEGVNFTARIHFFRKKR